MQSSPRRAHGRSRSVATMCPRWDQNRSHSVATISLVGGIPPGSGAMSVFHAVILPHARSRRV